jgi:hypothetical protein
VKDKVPSSNVGARRSTQPLGAMRSLKLLCLTVLVGVAGGAFAASQNDWLCRATLDPEDWIESIRISPSQSKVWLKLKSNDSADELPLLYANPEQADQPSYAFNSAVAGTNVVNAFRVFRVSEQWRLISAGMEERQGTLVLKALGSSVKLACEPFAPNKSLERTRER